MSEVLPTEEMLRAQRLMADMPDQIQNFFNSDVRKLFATIDHWRQRAEQAEADRKVLGKKFEEVCRESARENGCEEAWDMGLSTEEQAALRRAK